jgi:regulator of replication initiation timing
MKRKGTPAKEGKCPRIAPKDQKCDNCRSKKRACQFAARIAAANAILSPGEPSTSERPRPQAAADSDMDDAEPRPSRERKAPERIEVDANITSRATGQRWSAHSCCPNHMDADPSTSEPAPKPKFTGPMDKYLGDKRVEAAVNRAVKSITDNPADLERELRDFAQTAEGWRQKSMSLEQENDAIQNKLDKVTKELEKVKKKAAREIGNFDDAEDHQANLKAIVGSGYAHGESGRRLLRMHAAAIVEKVQATAKGMSSRTLCRTRRSSSARLTTRSPRASRLSRSMSRRTSSCATFSFLRCVSSPTFFSYEPRTARRSCSCSLERAGIFTTGPRCHGMLA